ncbi:bifunctional hydroxymethylpyrimidine kinase/phosphomethylpyrimidine kinase [Agarilytica rhodophyticola]|uniref:bifunctional hydroxymethylpyrimidine kinase/phosphomethylpyrimidine kinase n=1 Tax=Agarilytica rhodophyticola TaxID=1737490 RepID=UPI000B344F45|nr:hydroxymethylpyrimidine/phosphomethylpyrimidine kinase [Agarilytica rhodophyticola]
MTHASSGPPIVLAFSVLDPSGSGGIQADIETAASLGCHCTPIITALCAEGSIPETETVSVDPTIIIEQARSVLAQMNVSAIKIGFLGSRAIAEAIHSILQDYNTIPVVSHPALSLLDDENSDHHQLVDAYTDLILPASAIANFSLFEARAISGEQDTVDTTAHAVIASGCQTAFITGTGKQTQAFQNSAYNAKGLIKNYQWQQEQPISHGSASTLAMSMAAYLAHGFNELQTIEQAQNYTWQSMRAARDIGFGRSTPHRLFWADQNIETTEDILPGTRTH